MKNLAGPCAKCGGTARQASGRCVTCRRTQRLAMVERRTFCPGCGGSDFDAWGCCKPCRAVSKARKGAANLPCEACGTADRYPDGRCRSCTRSGGEARGARNAVCGACGTADRFRAGQCKVCHKRRLLRLHETSAPCGACGSKDRSKSGACKPCSIKYERKFKYGITDQQFRAMIVAQSNGCAACGDALAALPPKHIHVDHDHSTGAVRGVLCQGCNTAIGLLRDSPSRAMKVASYLRRNAPTLPFARKGAA